jgi:hypothetical protein
MRKHSMKATIGAILIAATCHSALAAGPVSALKAPSATIEVKNNKAGAAAVGAIAGAAIVLGILGAANANAAPPPRETYVAPPQYGFSDPSGSYDDYYSYVLDNPGEAVEVCRKGILHAARQYGARRATVNSYGGIRDVGNDTVRFRASITVFYPGAARRSNVVCSVQDGYLVSARASN